MDDEPIEVIGSVIVVWMLMLVLRRELEHILQLLNPIDEIGVVASMSGIVNRYCEYFDLMQCRSLCMCGCVCLHDKTKTT